MAKLLTRPRGSLSSWNTYWLLIFFKFSPSSFLFSFFKRFYLFIFRARGREGERGGNINVWLSLVCPQLGTWPTTQSCALTGNQTGDPWVSKGLAGAYPLSHTSQRFLLIYFRKRGRERETSIWGKHQSVASCTCPIWGPKPQCRHVPWPEIEQGTLGFAAWHSTNWATLVRAHADSISNHSGRCIVF